MKDWEGMKVSKEGRGEWRGTEDKPSVDISEDVFLGEHILNGYSSSTRDGVSGTR